MVSLAPRALVIGHKVISSAPRILRELQWLAEEGWVVDSMGLGDDSPVNGVHIKLRLAPTLNRYISYLIWSKKTRFWLLYGRYFPTNLTELLNSYDLVIVHDISLLSLGDIRDFVESRKGVGVHVDLHENHVDSLSRNLLEHLAFDKYRAWELSSFKSLVQNSAPNLSVSSVSEWIGKRFSQHLNLKVSIIRNAPSQLHMDPSPVNRSSIQLVHHGVGTSHRGIEASIIAMRLLPSHYSLNLHLVSSASYLFKIKLLARIAGVHKKVAFRKPVQTKDIASAMNSYDIALIVIPPRTKSLLHSLPNKFLESIQAKLAIVTGPNPEMSRLVSEFSIGRVLAGWSANHIASGILSLTPKEISDCKENARLAGAAFSSNSDREVFLGCIENCGTSN
jgi:hypothetical protein